MTANRSTRPVLPTPKTPGGQSFTLRGPQVNKHSLKLFVAATGSLLPLDTLLRLLASRPPLKGIVHLMRLSLGAAKSLSIQEKHFSQNETYFRVLPLAAQ